MSTPLASKPGYTAPEAQLLQALFQELGHFTALPDWPARLPFQVCRSFVLERLENPVQWTIGLYQRVGKASGAAQVQLLLDLRIQGTGKEAWSSSAGGFRLSHGPPEQVAADIIRLSENLQPVQQQLYEEYYAAFYNA
ncbi:hypothetical protein [Hymenobacter chitinivorans]|uniref:Uncharacterized protein n=1 Tax=Hymenobacter chitinivorans DSM 11115 TaxID=1121954 RepID=A0A2M9BTI3_9BACT|nr:hypothetical protein [Hymenobacter chitinivorans]PJJ61270.1 hypothetical protein CLV45_2708 [Hymenobacter chitinivorans DSM 11115]